MAKERLEDLLVHPDRAPFYDLLGGLADNLLTIGSHAGSFLACASCGDTFTLKDESWRCGACGQNYSIKFGPSEDKGAPFKAPATVSGLTKPRMNPHWYFNNENWSVAEFMTQILRLRPETFLAPWFQQLGHGLDPEQDLESVLSWPRFAFGGKTIQPDLAVGFENDLVLVEFKRPEGGTVPPVEILGQICFAVAAARRLGREWHLLLVPGSDRTVRPTDGYIVAALSAVDEALAKWGIPAAVLAEVQVTSIEGLSKHLRVVGWETLLQTSERVILEVLADSWTTQQALLKLRYFHDSRAALGLLPAREGN